MPKKSKDLLSPINIVDVKLENGEIISLAKRHKSKPPLPCFNESEIDIELYDDNLNENENENSIDIENNTLNIKSFSDCSTSTSIDKKLPEQFNTNARIKDEYWSEKERDEKNKNVIYCQHQLFYFVLRFNVTNVRMTILRCKDRTDKSEPNAKETQSISRFRYTTYLDYKSAKLWLTKKVYRLDNKPTINKKIWKSTSTIRPTIEYVKEKQKSDANDISKTYQEVVKGSIELRCNEIAFNFVPPVMMLEITKSQSEDDNPLLRLQNKLKNRGSLLAKINEEIVLFKFDLNDIQFSQVWLKTTRATQSEDHEAYIQFWSTSLDRNLHCPIPMSTYKYENPMPKIRNINRTHILKNKYPEWMREVRNKRLKDVHCFKIDDMKSMTSKSWEILYGTQILFDNQYGSLCKVKTGVVEGSITQNMCLYDKVIMNHYRQFKAQNEKPSRSLIVIHEAKHEGMAIPDYDLTANNM